MRSVHYIGLGAWGCSYIYYSKIDKLYCVLEKGVLEGPKHKPIPYRYAQLMGGLFILLLFVLFYHTPYIKWIFSLNIWQCILISIISGLLYRNTIIASKLEKISKMKLTEISFENAIKGHYFTLKNHTNFTLSIDIVLYVIIVFCWANKLKLFNSLDELDVLVQFLIFISFVIDGILFAITDPIGRIKLLHRIRQEKCRLKKEKRILRK